MLIAFNKPYGVLCQFSDGAQRTREREAVEPSAPPRPTLAGFGLPKDVYAAGRLDVDSEGLLLLTDEGGLAARISSPRFKLPKTYLVQVEGEVSDGQLVALRAGVVLKDGPTLPAEARRVDSPEWLWPRDPPVRFRKTVPDAWIALTIREGRNRQVRRMTAAVGLPTLRLVRVAIGPWRLDGLAPGQWRAVDAGAIATPLRSARTRATLGAIAPRKRRP